MRLVDTLPTKIRLVEERQRSNTILLREITKGMTLEQRRIVEGVYNSALPIIEKTVITEATLTPDQINQLFTDIENTATDSGKNRTALGKGKDVVAAADKMIKDAGKWLQDTAPVQGFDAKFEKLKLDLKDKLSQSKGGQKTLKIVQDLGDYAKENPAKTAFAIGILTALAAVAGGPVGGAIAGQVLRGSMELVKGEKLSTAVGKGAYTAVKGFLAGKAIEFVKDNVISQIWSSGEQGIADMEAAFNKASFDDTVAGLDPRIQDAIPDLEGARDISLQGTFNRFSYNYNMTLTADQAAQYNALKDAVNSAAIDTGSGFSPEAVAKTVELHDYLIGLQNSEATQNLTAAAQALKEIPKNELTSDNIEALYVSTQSLADKLDTIESWGEASAAAVQGAVTAIDSNVKQQQDEIDNTPMADEDDGEGTSFVRSTESVEMTEAQVRQLFVGVSYLTESQLDEISFSDIKAQAAKIAQRGLSKAQEVGKGLTTRVTASKLMKAWKKAGSPTDSNEIAKLLRDQNVEDGIIKTSFQNTGIEIPPEEQPGDDAGEQPTATDAQAPAQPSAKVADLVKIINADAKLKAAVVAQLEKAA